MVETQYPVAGSFGMPPPDRGYSAPVIQGPKFVNPSGGYPPDSRSLSPPPFYFLMEIPGNHPLILIKGGWHPRIWSTRRNKFRPQRISLFRISGFVLIWFASTCFPSFFLLLLTGWFFWHYRVVANVLPEIQIRLWNLKGSFFFVSAFFRNDFF